MQVGLSLKSHDPSQRANGFLTLAGGVIITFAKEILTPVSYTHLDVYKRQEIVGGEPDEGEAVGGRKEKSYER